MIKLYIIIYCILIINSWIYCDNTRVGIEDYNQWNNEERIVEHCNPEEIIHSFKLGKYSDIGICNKVVLKGKLIDIDCKKDTWTIDRWSVNKKEKNRYQNPFYKLTSHTIASYSPESNTWNLILFQNVSIDTGAMIVNNVKEHLAYYNTKVILSNEIISSNNSIQITYDYSTPSDSDDSINVDYSKLFTDIQDNSNNRFYGIGSSILKSYMDGWSVKTDHVINQKTKWIYHLRHPYNTLTDLPSNFHDWMRERLHWGGRGYISYNLPQPSINKFDFTTVSMFKIRSNGGSIADLPKDSFTIRLNIDHYLGDIVVGSGYPDHNAYREIKYGSIYDVHFKN